MEGFFCLHIAQVALARGPGVTLSFLCSQPFTYSETQGWRRGRGEEGLHAGVWAALVRSGENHQEYVGSFLCVFRNNCVFKLAHFVATFCSVFVDFYDQWNEIGKGLMTLLFRRNVVFDSYVFLYVTPLIYAIAFYCLLNVAFEREAFR